MTVGRLRCLLGAPGVLLIAVSCTNAEPQATANNAARRRPAQAVEVVIVSRDTVVDAILATGAIEALQYIELIPEVQGRLTRILVREGTEVKRGKALFKVDDAELKALVAQLEAERDLANQSLKRAEDLAAKDASSPAELDAAEAAARSAEARLLLQQVRLRRTLVRAPFSGIVGERLVSLGDYVTTSTSLTTLQTVDPQRASFQVPERYSGRIGNGQVVVFKVAAVDQEFTGIVDFVNPVVQLPSRTITVKARVPNPDRRLKPGMFIEASIATEIRPQAIVIPEDAVLTVEGSTYVWVIADDRASRRNVQLGVRTPGWVEVLSGLDEGEKTVVGGVQLLFEGASVQETEVERTRSR